MVKPLRQRAEQKFANELALLKEQDSAPKPQGWQLSPRAVKAFILGEPELGVDKKYYGEVALVERAIVSLMSNQGLMLVGPPGTAKSMLSELLACAISGTSELLVQGTAGTSEEQLKYTWNFAQLLSNGPSLEALVKSPIYHAMEQGKIARIEELTRCPQEIQDALISILSEKQLTVPELGVSIQAQPGFNLIGTANLADKGVNEMSSALKRRFNFETVPVLQDPLQERRLIQSQVSAQLEQQSVSVAIADELVALLVQVFNDLRRKGQSNLQSLEAVLSTAEAVNIVHACALQSHFLQQPLSGAHIAQQMHGSVIKDNVEDMVKLASYLDIIVRERAREQAHWRDFFEAGKVLWMS
ncbi:hypothetical protein PRUB_a1878 [Pseudoalteromonas rubra]|uniref:ATPase dynein-related AAA domain-containing protein n=1 Tax=Pseudoalteromonas rubra TaxID=43658 RepID=A0A8T0CDI1_9GAMM|nr:AAA family ATPase [Pseudoalteromonas rubra]KAF7788807.1 hypothetical protein PRUB_a1878 [Pseudoalteromonas rubra]